MWSLWIIWVVVTILSIKLFFPFLNSKNKRLPPGPRPLPIIGNLHLLGKNLHRDLHDLSKKYGPIMHLQLGFITNIVVSSPRGAELFLKTHDTIFATRPSLLSAKHMVFDQSDLSFSKYGSYWRNIRKLCTLKLLSNFKINSLRSIRSREVNLLVKSLKESSSSTSSTRRVINLGAEVASLSMNISCLMVFGKKYSDKEFNEKGFQEVVRELMYLFGVPHLGDYFPFLGSVFLDPQGLTRRMKKVSKIFGKFLDMIIDEHLKLDEKDQNGNDFVWTMLELMRSGDIDFEFDRRHIKGVMLVRLYVYIYLVTYFNKSYH